MSARSDTTLPTKTCIIDGQHKHACKKCYTYYDQVMQTILVGVMVHTYIVIQVVYTWFPLLMIQGKLRYANLNRYVCIILLGLHQIKHFKGGIYRGAIKDDESIV